MPGYVVDSSAINMDDIYTKPTYTPASGASYSALTMNGVNQTAFDRRFPFWVSANWLAQMYSDGFPDAQDWGVADVTAP